MLLYKGSKFLGSLFKVKLIKEGFDSETNAEFIPVWVRDRQAVLVIRNASCTEVQSELFVALDAPNHEL